MCIKKNDREPGGTGIRSSSSWEAGRRNSFAGACCDLSLRRVCLPGSPMICLDDSTLSNCCQCSRRPRESTQKCYAENYSRLFSHNFFRMDLKEHTTPDRLLRYSFLWSEARLVIAAIALFLGGIPPIMAILPAPGLYSIVGSLLTLAWIISGVAAVYLLYSWFTGGKRLFGGNAPLDSGAFFVMVVSGLNLGFAGIMGTNIGMNISMSRTVFAIVGVLYLAAALYLYRRWSASGQKLL